MEKHERAWWQAYSFDNPLRYLFHNPKKILEPHLKPGSTALDYGCGMGFFSLGMARVVGPRGRVVSTDTDARRLQVVRRRAARAGLSDRIQTVHIKPDEIGSEEKFDFAMCCWVVHELYDRDAFMERLHEQMNDGARLFVAEPRMHVADDRYGRIKDSISGAGFKVVEEPRVALSKSAVFEKI